MSYMSDNSGSVEVLNNSVLPAMASPVTVSTLVEANFPDRQFSEITLAEAKRKLAKGDKDKVVEFLSKQTAFGELKRTHFPKTWRNFSKPVNNRESNSIPNEGTVRISVANNSGSFTIWPVG